MFTNDQKNNRKYLRLLFKYAINKMGSRDLSGGFILSVLQQEKSEAENIEIRYIHIKDEFEMSELMSESVSESVSESMSERCLKPLPIGFSDYIRTQSEYYYVDKILLIKEFLAQNHWYRCLPGPEDLKIEHFSTLFDRIYMLK